MNHATAAALRGAVDTYLEAPTGENRERLIHAADDYREAWIVARVPASAATASAKGKAPPTTYTRELEVTRVVDGIPTKLALQERTSASVDEPWWTLSWRTKYSADGSNRRFYLTKEGPWTIPATIALDMFDEMESLGGLRDEYVDRRRKPSFASRASTDLTAAERAEALQGITGPGEDWGADPFFVINFDPNDQWKKVLLINTESGIATFRSITEDPDYMPKKVLRPGAAWWLDNSMMDANVQQMRVFQSEIRKYLSSRSPA